MSSANISKVVERRVRNWEIAQHQHPKPEPEGSITESIQFYIAISRELGSLGELVADQLVECLGWPKYDKEILTYMSEKEEVRGRLYETLDERQRGWLQQLADLFEPMGINATHTRDEYFRRMSESVIAISQHEHAIFVGRGVSFILPPSRGLSVRIVAPIKLRVARMMEYFGVSERESRRRIHEVESQRAEFLVTHFGARPYDPRRYDMVLNSAAMSAMDMSCLIRQAAERKSGQPLPCEKVLA